MSESRPAMGTLTQAAFSDHFQHHAGELRVHCYRMLGSFDEAEDVVQETFLRAWRGRERFEADGRLEFRAWLYRIATNACIDVLRARPRRVMPGDVAPAADPNSFSPEPADLPWLQPYPDRLLDEAAGEEEPGALVVARETIELAFIAAIQHLSARERAALILRDVVGWSAREAASLLDVSVAAVNSALQRARAELRERLGAERGEWRREAPDSDAERELLRGFLDAHERADIDALASLLREDVRLTMPPMPVWFDGRDAVLTASAKGFEPEFGELRGVATAANRQPAVGWYLRAPGDSAYRPLALDVLTVGGDGRISVITSFVLPEMFGALGLPGEL